jgi:hypothetical protein
MTDFSGASIERLVVHKAGNKSRDEGFVVSPGLANLEDDTLHDILINYFLKEFMNQPEAYRFVHQTDLLYNEIYNYARQIFFDPQGLYLQSINILKHLYEQSEHPKIKSGEVYVAHFRGLIHFEQRIDAIGIFKSENKDPFLKFEEQQKQLGYEFGINTQKLDKGCLILNVEGEEGYRIYVASSGGNAEAQFWTEDFLHIDRIQDNHWQTKNYLTLCKDFVEEVYSQEQDKREQVVFMNKSIEYFSTKDKFDADEFANDVFHDPAYVEQFRDYKQAFEQERGIEVLEDFAIFKPAVKNMKKKFKNFIKLDTDVEIKLNATNHTDRSDKFVERGFDEERQMHYYKIYFNQES